MKNNYGYILIFFLELITLNLWLLPRESLPFVQNDLLLNFSRLLSLLGIVLMSVNLALSTRLKIFEDMFGGLDKTYTAHHLIGILAFIFLINHPILLIIKALPSIPLAYMYTIPNSNLSYSLGILAVYSMVASVIFMVFIKLPYHLWKLTHQILGVSFILGSAHALLVGSDMESNRILRYWILLFIVIGITAYIYNLFFYKILGPKYKYKVTKIERLLDVVVISLKPVNKTLTFLPGQFIYTSFSNKDVGNESHPFSLTSCPTDTEITICAKIMGDYTLKLPSLKIGDVAFIYGPYGKFGQAALSKNSQQIWIAGGIGITPFLSLLKYYSKKNNHPKIDIFCSVRNQEESVFSKQIIKTIRGTKKTNFYEWVTNSNGKLSVEKIKKVLGPVKNRQILLCGPAQMMESLKTQFISNGIAESDIYFENFQLL